MVANNQRAITLPPFWADNAARWFAHVESRFRAKGVMEEWDRFDHTVAALSKDHPAVLPRGRPSRRRGAIFHVEGGSPAATYSHQVPAD
jgi:hypothetical protein